MRATQVLNGLKDLKENFVNYPNTWLLNPSEAVVQRCSVEKVFLEISQNSQENTYATVFFLIKLQAYLLG